MRRRDALRAIALAPIAGEFAPTASAFAEAPAIDAATAYREAVARLPDRSKAEADLLDHVATARLDRTAEELVERAKPALDLLAKGASAPTCDWGDTWTGDGFETASNFAVVKAPRLAKLASLRARLAFEAGRTARGIDDVIAALTLGRHVALGRIRIAQVVGMSIESRAIEAAGASLPRLDREGLRTLEARLLALPPITEIADTVRGERAWFIGYMWPRHRDEIDAERAAKWLSWCDRLADACSHPDALAALRSEAKSDPDTVRSLNNFDAEARGRAFTEVMRAMFRAAIGIALDGPGAVGRVPDPSDGRPFDYRSWATGFELKSRFALPGKPNAILVVGRR